MSEDELNNAVNSMPFLAKQRLVLLANPSARYNKADGRKKFLEFIEKIPDSTRLVIYESVEPRDAEKHWLNKWAEKTKLAQTQAFMLPRVKDMSGWNLTKPKIKTDKSKKPRRRNWPRWSARNASGRAGNREVAGLCQLGAPDQGHGCGSGQHPHRRAGYLCHGRRVGIGNGKSAQRLLHRLLENEDAFSVWGMVVRQFRLLLLAREVIDDRGGQREVEQALGVHSFVAEKVFSQAKRFSLPALEKIYHKLLEIDEAAKTGQVTLDLAMETLVVELTA